MKKILSLIAAQTAMLLQAQTAPSIQWQKSLGGTNEDYANSIQQTTDGGYITAGSSLSNDGDVIDSHGGWDIFITKLNSSGALEWKKSYGGSSNDLANSVRQTSDGGYIIAGRTNSIDGDVTGNSSTSQDHIWIVKINSTGTIQWQKFINTLGLNNGLGVSSDAKSIIQTSDGGYFLGGNSYFPDQGHAYDEGVGIKLSSAGVVQWGVFLGGNYHDEINSVNPTSDGGYIVAGQTASNDLVGYHPATGIPYDYFIAKISAAGSVQWYKVYGGSGYDVANSVQQTSDGGYILAGYASSTDGDVLGNHSAGYDDYWILKLNSSGNIQWQKSLGSTGNDEATSIQQTTDDGYIVTGGGSSANNGDITEGHGNFDYWVVKLSSIGNIKWQKSLGGSSSDGRLKSSIMSTSDGGYIVAGESASNNGDVTGNHGANDYWIVKLSPEGLATQELNDKKIGMYPNPVKDILHFTKEFSKVSIIDIQGRVVLTSASSQKINVSALAKGVYIVNIKFADGTSSSEKVVKE